jgi:hypothetical protein
MRVYIAGGMRNYEAYNFPAFDAARDRLKVAGHEPVNPADLDREVGVIETTDPLPPNFLHDAMERDLKEICHCDAVALLPGWETSQGAAVEVALAKLLGLKFLDAITLESYKFNGEVRTFNSGATRNTDAEKPDYEGFLSPLVIEAFGAYMHKHRIQADGKLRDSDNWQKLFGEDHYAVCIKSASRHFLAWWKAHRGYEAEDIEESMMALMFNVQAYMHKRLTEKERL